MTTIINLMPYDATIASKAADGQITTVRRIPKSDKAANVVKNVIESGEILGVPTVRVTYGSVVNLPEPQEGVKHIVLPIVAQVMEQTSRSRETDRAIRDVMSQVIGLPDSVKSLVGEFLGPSSRNDLIGMDTNRAIRAAAGNIIGSPAFVLYSKPEQPEVPQKGESASTTSQSRASQGTVAVEAEKEKIATTTAVTPRFVNLTPHAIDIAEVVDGQLRKKMVIPASGQIARVDAETIPSGEIDGIPAVRISYGKVSNMPPAVAGVTYIAGMIIGQALQGQRDDIVGPDMDTVQYGPDKKIFGVLRLIRY